MSVKTWQKRSLCAFCNHFLQIKGNGKEGKVHIDPVFPEMSETAVRHIVFHLTENSLRLYASLSSQFNSFFRGKQFTCLPLVRLKVMVPFYHTSVTGSLEAKTPQRAPLAFRAAYVALSDTKPLALFLPLLPVRVMCCPIGHTQ